MIFYISIFLILTVSINHVFALLPTNTCVAYEKSCKLEHNNLIGFYTNISHVDECDLLCAGEYNCRFSSYFGPNSHPIINSCVLLNNCPLLEECNNCYTHEKNCFNACDAPIQGGLSGNNILNVQEEILKKNDCQRLCDNSESCRFYTYFGEKSTIFSRLVYICHCF